MNERNKMRQVIYLIDLFIKNYHRNIDLIDMSTEYKRIRKEYESLDDFEGMPKLKKIIKIDIKYFLVAVFIISVYMVYNIFQVEDKLLIHYIPLFITVFSIPIGKFFIGAIQNINEELVLQRLKSIKASLGKKI